MFGCALNYCAMRLLGVDKSDPDLVKARKLLHKLGILILMWKIVNSSHTLDWTHRKIIHKKIILDHKHRVYERRKLHHAQ